MKKYLLKTMLVAGLPLLMVSCSNTDSPGYCDAGGWSGGAPVSRAVVRDVDSVSISSDSSRVSGLNLVVDAPNSVAVGREFPIQIRVINGRDEDARLVLVSYEAANAKFRLKSSNPQAVLSGGAAHWNFASVPARGEVVINLIGIAMEEGELQANGTFSLAGGSFQFAINAVRSGLEAEVIVPGSAVLTDKIPVVYRITNRSGAVIPSVIVDGGAESDLISLDGKQGGRINIGNISPGECKEVRFWAKARRSGLARTSVIATSGDIVSNQPVGSTMIVQPAPAPVVQKQSPPPPATPAPAVSKPSPAPVSPQAAAPAAPQPPAATPPQPVVQPEKPAVDSGKVSKPDTAPLPDVPPM